MIEKGATRLGKKWAAYDFGEGTEQHAVNEIL